MGKFYEDLITLNELIAKLKKKDELAEFIIRAIRNMKDMSQKRYPIDEAIQLIESNLSV